MQAASRSATRRRCPISRKTKIPPPDDVPLSGWEDCIVWMENQFTTSRRYSCVFPSFSDMGSAAKTGEVMAKELVNQCLGSNYSISAGRTVDGIPRRRIVGRGTSATVTITPSKSMLSPTWELRLDVQ
jgi:hypothetical protein